MSLLRLIFTKNSLLSFLEPKVYCFFCFYFSPISL